MSVFFVVKPISTWFVFHGPSLPMAKIKLFLQIVLLCCCLKITLRSFHQGESKLQFLWEIKSLQPPYLHNRIVAHNWFWLFANSHPHLASKASLNLIKSLIPNPPLLLGRQTMSHLTQGILMESWRLPHQKFLCIDVIFCTTSLGILKKDSK